MIIGYELTALILLILALSIVFDLLFGELPTKIHPVVFIGKLIDFFSKYLEKINNRFSGFILTILVAIIATTIFGIILILASFNMIVFIIVAAIILSSTFSIKMLLSSAKDIKKDLERGLDVARKSMSYLVSRNTKELSEKLIISATIETLSENITDSAVAPIFYYILINIAVMVFIASTTFTALNPVNIMIIAILVAMIYRVVNTLDAMVGYKNERYMNLGYFPAKLDDILNYIPARFSGLVVVLATWIYSKFGKNEMSAIDWRNSYRIMKRDARNPPSPNSGYTMASVAGALNISLVKEGVYVIGDSKNTLKREDIGKAISLSRLAIYQAILILLLIFLFLVYFSIFGSFY